MLFIYYVDFNMWTLIYTLNVLLLSSPELKAQVSFVRRRRRRWRKLFTFSFSSPEPLG